MPEAHREMRITDAQFGDLVENLQKTHIKFKVPEKEQSELLGVLGPMKPAIVGQWGAGQCGGANGAAVLAGDSSRACGDTSRPQPEPSFSPPNRSRMRRSSRSPNV